MNKTMQCVRGKTADEANREGGTLQCRCEQRRKGGQRSLQAPRPCTLWTRSCQSVPAGPSGTADNDDTTSCASGSTNFLLSDFDTTDDMYRKRIILMLMGLITTAMCALGLYTGISCITSWTWVSPSQSGRIDFCFALVPSCTRNLSRCPINS